MIYEDIKKQFNRVISYSQEIDNPNTDELFEKWYEAKKEFIENMFDGNLIFDFPGTVSFELDKEDKDKKISGFIDLITYKYDMPELADFIADNWDGFFTNNVIKETNYNGNKIPKGMKLLRAFKFFTNDKELLNELQSVASMLIQETKIEGTLCLSVHPLDFLSVSENNHNWRSCHALDGDYRSGNLSYMVDKSTIICYLRSKNNEKLPHFPMDVPWNSKKWRVLLYFSENWDMIFAGRQYPFNLNRGLDFVKDKLLEGEWTPWLAEKIRNFCEKGVYFDPVTPYVPVDNHLILLSDLVKDMPGSLQFNDVLSSTCYDPLYSFKINRRTGYPKINYKKAKFEVGGAVNCVKCGEKRIELTESFMCNDCELIYGTADSDMFDTCSCCGMRFFADDGYWIEDAGDIVCPSCAESCVAACDYCGGNFYTDDMRYDEKTDELMCKYCLEEKEEWREEMLLNQKSLRD